MGFGGISVVAGWSREAVVTQGTSWMYLGVGKAGGGWRVVAALVQSFPVVHQRSRAWIRYACGTVQRVEGDSEGGRGAVL